MIALDCLLPVTRVQRDAAAEAKAAKSEAVRERAAARKRQQSAYQFAAIAASTLVTATAGFATYYRCEAFVVVAGH